jgi:hypothetical protein
MADALLLPPAALDRVRLAVLGAAALANLLSVRPLVQVSATAGRSSLQLGACCCGRWAPIRNGHTAACQTAEPHCCNHAGSST